MYYGKNNKLQLSLNKKNSKPQNQRMLVKNSNIHGKSKYNFI